MHHEHRTFLLALALALPLAGGCGGNVVVDGPTGNGGATTSTSTAMTGTTSFAVTGTSTGPFTSSVTTTGTVAVTSTSTGPFTSSVTSTSSGPPPPPDPCTPASNCTGCADGASCYQCNQMLYAGGVSDYNAAATCIVCDACFKSCSTVAGGFCSTPPAMLDPCDQGPPGQSACNTCQSCAIAGSCAGTWSACANNPDCMGLINSFQMCPMN